MPKNDVVWRGQTTSTLNLAPCRKVFNLFDHPLARFLRESKRRIVPRLFFPSIHMEIRLFTIWRGVKSFAPRTRIRFDGVARKLARFFTIQSRFCNVSPVNLECYLILDGEMKRWMERKSFLEILMNDYL